MNYAKHSPSPNPEPANNKDIYFLNIMETQHQRQNLEFEVINKRFEVLEEGTDQLDPDSYLFLSLIIESFLKFSLAMLFFVSFMLLGFCVLLLILLIIAIPMLFGAECQVYKEIKDSLIASGVMISIYTIEFLFFGLLMVPPCLVVCTQIICILQMSTENETINEENETMAILKLLAIIFFIFLSFKEVLSSLDTMGYFYKMRKSGEWLSFLLRILPQCCQITVCFFILYFTILIVSATEDSISLIQNFAGLAILLEFDNFIIIFFRNIGFYTLYINILTFLDDGIENKINSKIAQKKAIELKTNERANLINTLDKLFSKKHLYLANVNYDEQKENPQEQMPIAQRIAAFISDCIKACFEACCKVIVEELQKIIYLTSEESFIDLQISIKNILTKAEFKVDPNYELSQNEKIVMILIKIAALVIGCVTISLIFSFGEETTFFSNLS